ncbi:MAG: DUF2029 domain-containing protein [Planctomycetes bacterium]|nr:DUF2029 domain-containing protein [Planctomycetota bacterium]
MPVPGHEHRRNLALVGALAVIGCLCVYLQWWWSHVSLDISVYWEAGTRMRLGGADLYAPSVDPANHVGYYIYPPFFSVLFAPLTWLPRWAGYATWTLAQLALMFATLEGGRRIAGIQHRRNLALFLLAALCGALWMNLVEGQVNLLVAALVCWGWLWIENGRTLRGALLLAAAIHVKVIPIVLLPVLIMQGRFKAAAATLALCAALWLAPLVFAIPAEGIERGLERNVTLTREYAGAVAAPRVKAQDTGSLGGIRAPNNGLPATWQRWFGHGGRISAALPDQAPLIASLPLPVARFGGLALAALLGLVALAAARLRNTDPLDRAMAAGLALMAAMFGNLLFWPHHMCASVILLAPLYARISGTRWALAIPGALFVLAWMPIGEQVEALAWMGAWGTPTLVFLALWGLCLWITLFHPRLRAGADGLYSAPHEETRGNPAA